MVSGAAWAVASEKAVAVDIVGVDIVGAVDVVLGDVVEAVEGVIAGAAVGDVVVASVV